MKNTINFFLNSKIIFGYILIVSLFLYGCGSSIDQKNFNFEDYLVNNSEIMDELKNWDVDSAYIQYIGFTPDKEGIEKLGQQGKLSPSFDHYLRKPEGFFDFYDIEHPIIIVWALRKNTTEGNTFEESGINSGDIVDYDEGVGKSDAENLHSLGDYSSTTYNYTKFYLAALHDNFVKGHGKSLMLSIGYPTDKPGIDLFDDIIKLNSSYSNESKHATRKVGLYVKGKGITMVDPSKLNSIQKKLMNPHVSSDKTYTNKNNQSEIIEEPEGDNYEINEDFSGIAIVIVEKAYFYDSSDESTKRKAYILSGEQVSYTNRENGFIYIEYTNTNNKTTKGWMKDSDLSFN